MPHTISIPLRRRLLALAGATAAGITLGAGASGGWQDAWQLELSPPQPRDADLDGRAVDLARLDCAGCHATIAGEWSTTLHALAWVDPRYRAALRGKRRPESCHGCHAPEPLHVPAPTDRKPRARSGEEVPRELGITCHTCHAGPDGLILGPFGAATEAHPSERSERFLGTGSNALCLRCHRTTIGPVFGIGKDFEAARLGERGMSCVGCHMAPVERPLATDAGGRATPPRTGRSHRLQTPRDPGFLARAFELEARIEGSRTVVRVRNRAGHRIPGLEGRTIRIRAHLEGAPGTSDELRIDSDAYLPLEGTRELRLEGTARAVLVEGIHLGPHVPQPVLFLERRLPLGP